jgi:4-hydroxy-tetrahydrodipicolinate synthase
MSPDGAMVALVTPFSKGKIDLRKLTELVDFQLAAGIDAVVPCGTTGEGPTLSEDEKAAVISAVVRRVRGRVPVVAGAGGNDTRRTMDAVRAAHSAGADAALVVTPYYNRPTQEGLSEHYSAVARAGKLPIIIYNVPSRTGVSLTAETVARLARLKNIIAIKEASGNLDLVGRIVRTTRLSVLSGDDPLTFPIMALGGKGVISVLANIAPAAVRRLIRECVWGNMEAARELHYRLHPLAKAMFVETNPIPVKCAMRLLGRLNGELRLPLTPLGRKSEKSLREILRANAEVLGWPPISVG